MTDSSEITFLEVLAWLHCPMAAVGGYTPKHPRGDALLAQKTLDSWPQDTTPLKRFVPQRRQAIRWLQSTTFGLNQLVRGPSAPPPARALETGYWIREKRELPWTGVLRIANGDRTLHVKFRLPYLHRIHGMWEIVLLDTNTSPPSQQRRSDLMVEAAFLSDCFRALTGEHAALRLLAPAYHREEILNPPVQHIDALIKLVDIVSPIGFIRPGAYCNDSRPARRPNASAMTRDWVCPVRQAGDCQPFFSSTPMNEHNAHARRLLESPGAG